MNKHLEQQLTKLAWLENFIELQGKPQTQRLMERLARKPITRAAGLSGEGAPTPVEAAQVVVIEEDDNKKSEKKATIKYRRR